MLEGQIKCKYCGSPFHTRWNGTDLTCDDYQRTNSNNLHALKVYATTCTSCNGLHVELAPYDHKKEIQERRIVHPIPEDDAIEVVILIVIRFIEAERGHSMGKEEREDWSVRLREVFHNMKNKAGPIIWESLSKYPGLKALAEDITKI